MSHFSAVNLKLLFEQEAEKTFLHLLSNEVGSDVANTSSNVANEMVVHAG